MQIWLFIHADGVGPITILSLSLVDPTHDPSHPVFKAGVTTPVPLDLFEGSDSNTTPHLSELLLALLPAIHEYKSPELGFELQLSPERTCISMDRSSFYKLMGTFSNSTDQSGNFQVDSMREFGHAVKQVSEQAFTMQEFYDRKQACMDEDNKEFCLCLHLLAWKSHQLASAGTDDLDAWASPADPFVFRDPRLKVFAKLVCVPDHFHCSLHEMTNLLRMFQAGIDRSHPEYKNFFKDMAERIKNEWTHSRMDISAQEMFKFCDRSAIPASFSSTLV